MLTLRPEQRKLCDDVAAAWAGGADNVMAVASTGFGKTVCLSDIARQHNGAVAVTVHRREILKQLSLSLGAFDLKHRVIAPRETIALIRRAHFDKFGRCFIDPGARHGVMSAQTLTSRSAGNDAGLQRWLQQVTLGIYDECQHYTSGGVWGRAVEALAHAKQLHVTATPERADGKGLGRHADGYIDAMVEAPSIRWLIDNGRLCPMKYYAPDSDIDMSGLPVGADGDFTSKAMRERARQSHIVGDSVAHYRKFADGKRCLVFATDVETAEETAAAFRAAGITSVAVSGKTDSKPREKAFSDFEAGGVRVLVNVDLADEGVDIPGIEAVLLARPTWSLAKYMQMIGRALRLMPGKPHAVIIDNVRNWARHPGGPLAPRQWTLDRRDKAARRDGTDTIPQRVCLECTQPYEAYHPACPYCGAVPEPSTRSAPEAVDGDLTELDVTAMADLLARIERADMPDDAYRVEQIARNVPPVGRGADLRRHQAGRHRRAVLRELLAWWCGMQAHRSKAEVYRRFYHRFGVDMGTALTLNANDTDLLIERIRGKFAEDATL